MAERLTIARPYADAAFEYARDADALAPWSEMLRLLEGIVVDPRVGDALGSPKLAGDEKSSLLLAVAGDRMSNEMRNFVRILVDADRIALVPEVRQLFDAMRDEAEGVAKATIESPLPLSPEQLGALTTALQKRFGKRIEATVTHNPALIGGARITVGDTVIDGSVQARLDAMAQALRA